MNISHFLYHEDNYRYPYIPSEDSYLQKNNVFCVADGVTLELNENGIYPQPSDSTKVASIAVNTIVESINNDISFDNAYKLANTAIANYNQSRSLFQNREQNGYSFGSTLVATIKIFGNELEYTFLHDCFVQVVSKNLNKKINIIPHVIQSSDYFDNNYDWKLLNDKKVWHKEIRNHIFTTKQKTTIGYGVLDGFEGYEQYLQSGRVKLETGDLIVVGTDGFIEPIENPNFLSMVISREINMKRYEEISGFMRQNKIHKEKTAFFIYVL